MKSREMKEAIFVIDAVTQGIQTSQDIIFSSGFFFQLFRKNSFGGKLVKSQNSAQFLAQTPKILFKTQFSGKNMEF